MSEMPEPDEMPESDQLAESDLDLDDSEFDDPEFTPRIVVLGAGPIGLETALYARYLGYEVAVVERGVVANNVLRWGHVRMFSPFSMNRSPLGAAALQAQSEDFVLPAADELLTGKEYAERYLLPLAQSDLLVDCIHQGVEVLGIGRDGILKTDPQPGIELDRAEFRFRVHVRLPNGDEDFIEADAVIDTTGVFNQPNYLGHGGVPAIGELSCRDDVRYDVPDILGKEREHFLDKRVLVVGSGYSAATNVVALAELANTSQTSITWVTRRESSVSGPIPVADGDRLRSRAELAKSANSANVERFDQTSIVAIERDADSGAFQVTLGGKANGVFEFDQVIANVGFRPNDAIYAELQVDCCPKTQAPAGVSRWLADLGPIDALDQGSPGVRCLQHAEPNFFILGSKSFGRNSNFLLSLGLEQIRDAFTVIAGRENLDLYKTIAM